MKKFIAVYCRILKIALTLLMGLMIVPVCLQIFSRYTGLIPRYIWTEEAARFCFVWMVMIGSMIAVRDETHFAVDLLPHPQTRRREGIYRLLAHIGMLLAGSIFAWYGYQFAKFGAIQTSEMSGINMLTIYVSFPLGGVTWILFLSEKLLEDLRLIARNKTESDASP